MSQPHTLPQVAVATGLPVDRLRRHAKRLADQGLITKVGGSWVAYPDKFREIGDVLGRPVLRGDGGDGPVNRLLHHLSRCGDELVEGWARRLLAQSDAAPPVPTPVLQTD